MCYNCGCGVPDDDMGYGRVGLGGGGLTDEDFVQMAKKTNMTVDEAQKETYKLLKKKFEK